VDQEEVHIAPREHRWNEFAPAKLCLSHVQQLRRLQRLQQLLLLDEDLTVAQVEAISEAGLVPHLPRPLWETSLWHFSSQTQDQR
jgi:hypothetical protein